MRLFNALHVFLKPTHYSTILFFSCIMTHRTSAGCDFLQCCHQCLLVPGLKTAEPWLNSKRIMIGPTWVSLGVEKSQEFHVISPRWLSYVEPTPSFAARRFVSCSPFKTCRTSLATLSLGDQWGLISINKIQQVDLMCEIDLFFLHGNHLQLCFYDCLRYIFLAIS